MLIIPSGVISGQPQRTAIINTIKRQHWKRNLCVVCCKTTKQDIQQPKEFQPSCVIHLAQQECSRNAAISLARRRAPSNCIDRNGAACSPDRSTHKCKQPELSFHSVLQKYIFLILSHIFISYKLTESTSSCSTALEDFGRPSYASTGLTFWVPMLWRLYPSV